MRSAVRLAHDSSNVTSAGHAGPQTSGPRSWQRQTGSGGMPQRIPETPSPAGAAQQTVPQESPAHPTGGGGGDAGGDGGSETDGAGGAGVVLFDLRCFLLPLRFLFAVVVSQPTRPNDAPRTLRSALRRERAHLTDRERVAKGAESKAGSL